MKGLLAVGATTFAGVGVASAYRFVIERYARPLSGLVRPVRVAFATDLHFGPFIGQRTVAAWVDAILDARPDVILLGGDIVDARARAEPAPLLAELDRLRAPYGVFGVWGNHDHEAFRRLPSLRADVAAVGIAMLDNDARRVRDDLVLGGVDDLRQGRPDLPVTLARMRSEVADGEGATVLLSHNPDVLPDVPVDVGVTLAGHTHGGQVCLPGGVPIVTSSAYGRRFAQGWVRAPANGYVSRGLGVTWLPVRYACPAELTILDLVP